MRLAVDFEVRGLELVGDGEYVLIWLVDNPREWFCVVLFFDGSRKGAETTD